ncbi:cytochrome b family protein [Orientia tsutsugamushi str. Sido]|nr:cytochrome b family protein [Orientia tsutsugamushi str. Sido]
MFSSILLLFFLPWLDQSKVRSCNYRPIYRIAFWLFIIDCLVLGYVGGKPAEEPYLTVSRLAATYYFLHFLVLVPFISRYEHTLPTPSNII